MKNLLHIRHFLMASSVLAMATPAFAQEGDLQQEAGLNDIVVTAQRREESLQSVPVAVTAFGTEQLEQLRITNVRRLDALAPGLQVTTRGQQSSVTVAIRGITSGVANNSVDPKVGIYVDGVYVGRSVGSLFDLADIQRVEVLRGPQGTLFGRNATSGALNITTADPKGEWGVNANLSYGNYNAFRGKVTLDLPAFGPFSARLSYLHDQIDGDVENLLAGRTIDLRLREPSFGVFRYGKDLGMTNVDGVQASIKGDFGNLVATYRFDYTDSQSLGRAIQTFGVIPDSTGALLSGIIAFQPLFGGITNISPRRLDAVANASSKEHVITQGHSLTLALQATDNFSVKSISAYRKLDQKPYIYDLGGTGGNRFTFAQLSALLGRNVAGVLDPANAPGPNDSFFSLLTARTTQQKQFSQEVQFQLATDLFDLTAGLFYFHEKSPAKDVLGTFQPVDDGVVIPLPGLDSPFGNGLTSTVAINDSMAGYGQLTWHVTPTFDLTGGLRYTIDDRELDIKAITGGQGGSLGVGRYKASYEKLNYTAIANWRPSSRLTAYAKVATGYVSGGILSGIPYEPETLQSFEVGLKSILFDNRMRANIAGFYNKYRGLQVQQFVNGRQRFDNAGKATIKGIEAETEIVPFAGLTLSGNVSYTDFDYKEFIINGVDIADESRPVFLSKWTARGSVNYSAPEFTNGSYISARVDVTYKSKHYFLQRPIREAATGAISPLEQYDGVPARTVVDARLGLMDVPVGGGKVSLSAFGQNIFNERFNPYGVSVLQLVTAYDRGRTYGIELGAKF